MATTISWPPTPKGGRLEMVRGKDATKVLVVVAMSDLSANPYATDGVSLGDVIFRKPAAVRSSIDRVARRLRSVIRVDSTDIEVDGDSATVVVNYVDLESRDQGSVTING